MRTLILIALLLAATANGEGGYNYGTNDAIGQASYEQQPSSEYSEFNKEYFTYSAPEADFEDNRSVGELAASLKRNLRVLFIRAPENKGLEHAALSLAKQAAEQQTAIYVLTQQADLSSLSNKLQQLNHLSAKRPEVHFVKYRTPEDALNAQRTIQQEYDRLGGSSTTHNGGVAPVLDFTSKQLVQQQQQQQQLIPLLDVRSGVGADGLASAELEAAPAPASSYLPVAKLS
ncbi:Tb [Drosophila busckii]|uniref:Tb n=1 Tax=Drosophila busckii TaxID=30019 RepID=A0A0M4F487_DROBS|nr:uncharacterized protein LOC108601775 [Drosophila busckii]ALC46132.1 Tb [Drosophila busckii]